MKKQTLEEFIAKSKTIFGNMLDYSKVNYINSRNKIILICRTHGEFLIAPKDHLSYERGCQICAGVRYNKETFIEKSLSIHKQKYSYDKVVFVNVKNHVIITCMIHGEFNQTPDKHVQGQGCPKCKMASRKDLAYVIKMGTLIHNGKYDYSNAIFTKMFDKIIIICPDHGEFYQTPTNHINHKQSCPACMVGKSKKEKLWLDQLKIPEDYSHRTVILHIQNRRLIVDGYDSATNTIYEFYGDYWHGNPGVYKQNDINDAVHISFGQLYNKTINRENFLIQNGFNVISIWEKDFDQMQTQLDRRKR